MCNALLIRTALSCTALRHESGLLVAPAGASFLRHTRSRCFQFRRRARRSELCSFLRDRTGDCRPGSGLLQASPLLSSLDSSGAQLKMTDMIFSRPDAFMYVSVTSAGKLNSRTNKPACSDVNFKTHHFSFITLCFYLFSRPK